MDANDIKKNIEDGLILSEPIKKIEEEIEKTDEKVAVLKGVRGSGRSTVLLSKEKENLKSNSFSIYHHFEHVGIGASSEEVGEKPIIHRFECEMASALLHCLKKYGIVTQQDEMIEKELAYFRMQWIHFINKFGNLEKLESLMVSQGYYTENLVKEIREIFRAEKLNFLVDRFDWMYNRNPKAQECISSYFPLFDKVVLTTDDEEYNAGYPTINVDYGKDKEVVKEIIERYIYSKNNNEYKDYICKVPLDYLVEQANGDIEMILWVIKKHLDLIRTADFEYYSTVNNLCIRDIDEKLLLRKESKEEQKSQGLRPRFYI